MKLLITAIISSLLICPPAMAASAKETVLEYKRMMKADKAVIEYVKLEGQVNIGMEALSPTRGTLTKGEASIVIIAIGLKHGKELITIGGIVEGDRWVRGFVQSTRRPNRFWFNNQTLRTDPRVTWDKLREYILEMPERFAQAQVTRKSSL